MDRKYIKYGLVLAIFMVALAFHNFRVRTAVIRQQIEDLRRTILLQAGTKNTDASLVNHIPGSYIDRKIQWRNAVEKSIASVDYRSSRLPDVISIGVQKCGTDALRLFLSQHPYIRSLPVEAHFFETHKSLETYRKMLPTAADHELVFEKTPCYFWESLTNIHTKIHKLLPKVKIILLLCNPVKRALSAFAMKQEQQKMERTTFNSFVDDALSGNFQEKNNLALYRKESFKHIIDGGLYAEYINPWLEEFKDSIFIINGGEFIQNPGPIMEDLQDFLEIPKLLRREDFIRNETTGMFCIDQWWLQDIEMAEHLDIKRGCSSKGRTRSKVTKPEFTMSNYTRDLLTNYYRPYNQKLYKIVGRNFGW